MSTFGVLSLGRGGKTSCSSRALLLLDDGGYMLIGCLFFPKKEIVHSAQIRSDYNMTSQHAGYNHEFLLNKPSS
jgi:hypothetical protein